MTPKQWKAVGLAGVFAVALTAAGVGAEILIFEETFDANTGAEFYSTDPTNYGDWSEVPPGVTPYSDPSWPVEGQRLKGITPLIPGGGAYGNTAARQIPVPAAIVSGATAMRITFDSEVLLGGGYDPGGGDYGCYQGVLTGNHLTTLHSAGVVFGPLRYSDNAASIRVPWYENVGWDPDGVVHWDMLIEQQGGGVEQFTVLITNGANSFSNTWSTASDPNVFQFVNGEFTFGFYGDDGSGASEVRMAYDNLQVWQVPIGEELVFQETFDADTAAEFYSTDPANYGDWSEVPGQAPYSDPSWPVEANRLKAITPIGAGSFPNTAARQIPVTAVMANGTDYPMRITFDSEVLLGGTYNPGGGDYGCYQGVLTGDMLTQIHSAGVVFDVRRYSNWSGIYAPGGVGFDPDGVVHCDMLIEQQGSGVEQFTLKIIDDANVQTFVWATHSDPNVFQFVNGEFTFGFLGDDGSGASEVRMAYDNLQVWQVGIYVPPPQQGTLVVLR